MEYKLAFKDYNEALKRNKLLGLKCQECGVITVPPKMACRKCASLDMAVVELTGKGKIQTFTTCNVTSEGREDELPYIILLVELEEGAWIMGNLTGTDPTTASMELIGQQVRMVEGKVFSGDRYSAGEGTSPVFRLEA